jgi:hypothetical protein
LKLQKKPTKEFRKELLAAVLFPEVFIVDIAVDAQ